MFLSEEGEGDVKDEAWKGLETIEEAMKKRGGSGVWEEKVEELVRRRLEERGRARGLERLAERVPAAADTGSRERRDMLDGWRLRREGYLGCIL